MRSTVPYFPSVRPDNRWLMNGYPRKPVYNQTRTYILTAVRSLKGMAERAFPQSMRTHTGNQHALPIPGVATQLVLPIYDKCSSF